MSEENIRHIKEYTKDDILVVSAFADRGFKLDMDVGLKNIENIGDERGEYSENNLLDAKKRQRPLDVKETQFKNGQKSLGIYFPSYDVNRSMAVGYTSIIIAIPDGIDISAFRDSFVNELTKKFYELDLFIPSEKNRLKIGSLVKELADFAKQLFADNINQSTKADNHKNVLG